MKILSLDDEFLETLAGGGLPEDIVPALQYVWESKKMHRLKEGMTDVLENFLYKKYREHVETFDRGIYLIALVNVNVDLVVFTLRKICHMPKGL